MTMEDWRETAACTRGVDPELFFKEDEASVTKAKHVCETCPVRDKCLMEALNHREEYGVWGGLTAVERRSVIRHAQKRQHYDAAWGF